MSLPPALVLAVLLSLTCSAVAGRHLLQTAGNTFYHATSSMCSTGKMTASLTLDANVTSTDQVTNFTIRISNAPVSSATTITNPKIYSYGTGATVAQFSCTYTADSRTSIYTCNVVEKVSLTYAYKPVGTLKALIDAGLLKSPSPLRVSVQLYTTNFVLGGKATLSANVMATVQSTSFTITLIGVPAGSTPTFTTPGYYNSTSGALVAEFPCTFQLDATSGNYYVNFAENATLTTAYEPVGTLKTLIDAKLCQTICAAYCLGCSGVAHMGYNPIRVYYLYSCILLVHIIPAARF
ncbi:unnamed protein product [Closterium sp. Yama58-4]|nr:unnamed protein product [Closterium sp. Yama58-4]